MEETMFQKNAGGATYHLWTMQEAASRLLYKRPNIIQASDYYTSFRLIYEHPTTKQTANY